MKISSEDVRLPLAAPEMLPKILKKLSYYSERAKMLNRTIVKCLMFSFVATLSLAACTSVTTPTPVAQAPKEVTTKEVKQDWQVEWDRLLAEAKKEGAVLFYTVSGGGIREVGKAFEERFGIQVDVVAASAPEIGSRLVTEYQTGIFIADVVNTGGGTHHTVLKPAGIVKSYGDKLFLPEVLDPKVWRIGRVPFVDEDRTFVSMIGVPTTRILYNTDMVKEGEISSVLDLLKPQWKGRIVMTDPAAPGSGLAFTVFLARLWGMDRATQYLRELAKQDPVITRDTRQVVEWVARGKYPLSLAPQAMGVAEFLGLGAPVAYATTTEGYLLETSTGGLAMPARPARPNASKLFINWLLTKEGQTAWVKAVRMPGTRIDVPTEGISETFIAKPGDKLMVDNEEHFLLMEKMRPINSEVFAKQLR